MELQKLTFAQQRALKHLSHEWKSASDILYVSIPTLKALVKKGLVEHKYVQGMSYWHSMFYRLTQNNGGTAK